MKGDFCLPPKVLARVLTVLILVEVVLFAWGWFAPATPLTMVLILVAIAILAPAYFIKLLLHGSEETLWTRVVGCLTSAMIALGSLALAWGAGNGLAHHYLFGLIGPSAFFTFGLVIGSFVQVLENSMEDGEGKS